MKNSKFKIALNFYPISLHKSVSAGIITQNSKEGAKMPVVRVLHKPYLEDHELDALSVMLPRIVLEVLNIENIVTRLTVRLTVEDIVVKFEPLGPRDKMANDIELHIECDNYPSKEAFRDDSTEEIYKRTSDWINPGRALGVYLKLVNAGWKEGRKIQAMSRG